MPYEARLGAQAFSFNSQGSDLRGMEMGQSSLAERLGYRPEDRLLIVNCDDPGSTAPTSPPSGPWPMASLPARL